MRPARWVGAGLLLAVLAGAIVAARSAGKPADPIVGTIPVGRLPCCVVVDTHSGHVFVANSADNSVTVLDASSGAALRTVNVGAAPVRMTVDGRTGHIFIFNQGATVTMLAAASGAVLRTVPYPYSTTDVAVDAQRDRVFAVGASNGPGVAMFDTRSGRLVRIISDVGYPLRVGVDTRMGRVFVPSLGGVGALRVLDARSGRVVRMVAVGADPTAVAIDERRGRAFVTNTDDSTVSALDATSGRVVRTVAVGTAPYALAVDRHMGRVFTVNDGDHTVSVLDAPTGAVLRTVVLAGVPPLPTSQSAYLNPVGVVVDERHSRTFVVHRSAADPTGKPTDSPMNDQVTVLDAGSGRVLRTLSVGRFAVALAVDETRGRLFVLNTNIGCRHPPSVWTVLPEAVGRWLPFLPKLPRPVCTSQGSVTVIDTSRV